MAQEPTYPDEAKIGEDAIAAAADSDEPLNETLSHVVTVKQAEERSAEEERAARNRKYIRGAAIGIGSAALVAALLYARRSYRSSEKE